MPTADCGVMRAIWDRNRRSYNMTEARRETYNQLIAMGNTPQEAWALIEQMEFAEDYEEPETCHEDYEEDYGGE